MLKKNSSLTAAQIRSKLLSSASHLYWAGGEEGKRVDAKAALDEVAKAVAVSGAAPATPGLGANYPNPFNPKTVIPFVLESPALADIKIYNVSGQLVRSFELGNLRPGRHSIRWDGRGQSGESVATGVYVYKLSVNGNETSARKLLLAR